MGIFSIKIFMNMAIELGIDEKNIQYFFGRFIKYEMSDEQIRNVICKVVLFRKLSCSPSMVNALLSGDELAYKEMQNKKPRKMDRRKIAAIKGLQGIKLNDITWEFCIELLHKSGLITCTLPWDRFFYGRVLDPCNALIFIGVSASDFLFNHNYGWISFVFSLLSSVLFTIFIIIVNTLADFRQYKKIMCFRQNRDL